MLKGKQEHKEYYHWNYIFTNVHECVASWFLMTRLKYQQSSFFCKKRKIEETSDLLNVELDMV